MSIFYFNLFLELIQNAGFYFQQFVIETSESNVKHYN